MSSPKITIITAAFNSEKTISDTIESILNQSYENIEYLIIDGGSTDKTIEIIKKYQNLFCGRLIFISEKDKGIYDAWNKGLILSTGDWISFVGSDDILLQDSISQYVKLIIQNPHMNFISSKMMFVKANLDLIRITGLSWSNKMNSYNCITHVGSLHHKSLFEKIGHFNIEYQIAGDYDFLLRCSDIIRPGYIDIITVKVREGGISGTHIFRVASEVLKIKLNNKSRYSFYCYFDYSIMILKYYIRTNLTNFIKLIS